MFRAASKTFAIRFSCGRSGPWWASPFRIGFATETSTLTIIGTPAIAYGGNLTFLQLGLWRISSAILIVLAFTARYFRARNFLLAVRAYRKTVWPAYAARSPHPLFLVHTRHC